jgi:putative nucleotidyltransferase with HDIG domain
MSKTVSKVHEDSQFQSIPIEEFILRPMVLVDTYLKLPNGKYILVAKAGSNTPSESMEKYRAKNVDILFIRVQDYNRMIREMVRAASNQGQSKEISASARFEVIQQAMEAVYRETYDLGFNDEVYAHAKLVNHSTLTFIADNPKLSDLVVKFGQAQHDQMHHSMMVSMVAVMLGSAHDWVKPGTLEKIGLGGFFHDIGKAKLPNEVLSRPSGRLSRDERVIYESHPEIGAQILTAAGSVPDDVLLMVAEHHERADGSGYPRGLKDFHISPLARVVGLANAFVDAIAEEPRPLTSEVTDRVVEDLEMQRSGQFNRDALKALYKCLRNPSKRRSVG